MDVLPFNERGRLAAAIVVAKILIAPLTPSCRSTSQPQSPSNTARSSISQDAQRPHTGNGTILSIPSPILRPPRVPSPHRSRKHKADISVCIFRARWDRRDICGNLSKSRRVGRTRVHRRRRSLRTCFSLWSGGSNTKSNTQTWSLVRGPFRRTRARSRTNF